MIQLLLHLLGDYIFQTSKQAFNKTKKGFFGFYQCFLHCLSYSLPFLLITNFLNVILIFIFHFILDRTNIIAHLIALKNGENNIENFGYPKELSKDFSKFLYIITDNTLHLIINFLIIKYI